MISGVVQIAVIRRERSMDADHNSATVGLSSVRSIAAVGGIGWREEELLCATTSVQHAYDGVMQSNPGIRTYAVLAVSE